ncbi:hypothetical protein GDO78_016950, partial [Eleutherodactylus coqui]
MDGGALLFCALLLLVHCGREATAITIFSNSSSNFLVGRNISLIISYNVKTDAFISWYKDEVLIVAWQNYTATPLENYKGRLDIIGNGSLVITNITQSDSGNYKVSVEALGETRGSLTFPVKVY